MEGWLLFFYTVPAKPVGSRMRIWRKLARIGAVQLKGAIYLLPASEEHRETLQWLISETAASGGEAGFACAERIFPFEEAELRELFNQQRAGEYAGLGKEMEDLRRKMESFRKGTRQPRPEALRRQLRKLGSELHAFRRIDFFDSPLGRKLEERFTKLELEILNLLAGAGKPGASAAASLRPEDFQGRIWVTRPRPFVDRLASAWLIRRFIDPTGDFAFLPEEEITAAQGEMVSFDVAGGDFTHVEDLCTFEVLLARFDLNNPALRQLAEIVHDLDLKDDRYGNPATPGVELILSGLRDRALADEEILAQGVTVFDSLYASLAAGTDSPLLAGGRPTR